MTEWRKVRLGDCCEITSSKRIFYNEYVESGVPFYRSKEIIEKAKGDTISTPLFISHARFKEIQESFGAPQKRDLLLTAVGSLGIPYLINDSNPFYFKDGNLIWFKSFNGDLNSEFLYYWFKTRSAFQMLDKIAIGSAQKALTISSIKQISIEIPARDIQDRIVTVLSRYDALIENYQRQIKLIEEAAQRLYKEWFVDLRFPGHQSTSIINNLPQSWQKKTVEECLIFHGNGGWGKDSHTGKYEHPGKVIRGTDIEDIKTGRYSDLPLRFHTDNDIKKRTLKKNDLVFELSNGNINNIGRCLLIDDIILNNTGDNTICASFCKLLRPIDRLHALMLYWEIQDMQTSGRMLPLKKQGANGINNFDFDGFLSHVLLIPADESLISPLEIITRRIGRIQGEIALLREARDRLLPKLMSSEIDV